MIVKSIWGHTQREWGYEVRVDLEDNNGSIINECLTFPAEPSQQELDEAIVNLIEHHTRLESLLYQYETLNEDGTITYGGDVTST